MKTKILSLFAVSALLMACTDDGTHTQLDLSNYTVDKVVCQASSSTLVADNAAELDLQVAIYSKAGKYTDKFGIERDRYIEVPRERWRNHEIKFYVNGTQVTPPYKTGNATPAVLQCYAEVDGIRSSQSPAEIAALYQRLGAAVGAGETAPEEPVATNPFFFNVTVEAPYVMPSRKIPVVFHVIDMATNRSSGQILDAEVFETVIKRWNDIFGRRDGSYGGGNANLEFMMAIKKPDGTRLSEPGINRVYLSAYDINDINMASNIGDVNLWLASSCRVYTSSAPLNTSSPDYTPLTQNIFQYLVNNNLLASAYFGSVSGNGAGMPKERIYRPDRYLNVWVFCDEMPQNYASGATLMGYRTLIDYLPRVFPQGVYDSNALPLPSTVVSAMHHLAPADITMWNTNPLDLRITQRSGGGTTLMTRVKDPREAGLTFSKSKIANANTANNEAELAAHVGAFFGLVPNSPRTNDVLTWYDDYCDDTPIYNLWYTGASNGGIEAAGSGSTEVKYSTSEPYYIYRSNNIMDYYSRGTTITTEQLKRMDWVLNNAPGRMMWKDLTAISEQ